jgi:hypothetical protein
MIQNWIKFNEERDSKEEILENIKDILLELTDKGFIVNYNLSPDSIPAGWGTTGRFGHTGRPTHPLMKSHVCISKFRKDSFEINEIFEVIDRLKEYMKDNGYSTYVHCPVAIRSNKKDFTTGCFINFQLSN